MYPNIHVCLEVYACLCVYRVCLSCVWPAYLVCLFRETILEIYNILMMVQHTYSGGLMARCLDLYSQVAEALQICSDCIIQKYITSQILSIN